LPYSSSSISCSSAAIAAVAAAAAAVALLQQRRAARAAPQRGCVGRHLANRNEQCVSESDSYALLFLFFFCKNLAFRVSGTYVRFFISKPDLTLT